MYNNAQIINKKDVKQGTAKQPSQKDSKAERYTQTLNDEEQW